MGYCANMTDCEFQIKHKNFKAVIDAVKKLAKEVEYPLAWVTPENIFKARHIEDIFNEFGWKVEFDSEDEETDIIGIYFTAEKIGDEDELFDAIAPYVEKDSYIQMSGEDGAMWRWVFDGKECHNQQPKIEW